MAEIKVMCKNKKHIVLIDDEDLNILDVANITIHKREGGYTYAKVNLTANNLDKINKLLNLNIKEKRRKSDNRVQVTYHLCRLIMKVTNPDIQVDFINGNTLDNRKENLRLCTHKQRMRNRKPVKNSKSGFKGVHWVEHWNTWRALITIDGEKKFLGNFNDPVEAAHAYDKAAVKFFGEFAYTNFPEETHND